MLGLRSRLRALLVCWALEGCTLDASGSGAAGERTQREQGAPDAQVSGAEVPDIPSGGGPANGDDGRVIDRASKDAAVAEEWPEAGATVDDANSVDAGAQPVPAPVVRILDGETSPGEWDGAMWAHQSHPSNWGVERNQLSSLAVVMDDEYLWLRVEGRIELANAIVVYIDSVPGAGIAPSALTDRLGMLDDAISCGVSSAPNHAPDFAWGTRVMGGTALLGAPGWRELSSPGDLRAIDDKLVPTVCTEGVCETRISRVAIRNRGPIFAFARLVNGTGDLLSNQGLPSQADAKTDYATELMLVAEP